MDWKLQLGISIVVPIVSSLLTYLAAIKKSKNDVEAVKISAETEIKKIREESDKELKRIQKETDEQIRLKIAENDLTSKTNEEQLKNVATSKFLEEFITKSQEHLYIDGIVSCPYTEKNVIKDILILVPKNELINTI